MPDLKQFRGFCMIHCQNAPVLWVKGNIWACFMENTNLSTNFKELHQYLSDYKNIFSPMKANKFPAKRGWNVCNLGATGFLKL
jgi:hypothetical protein